MSSHALMLALLTTLGAHEPTDKDVQPQDKPAEDHFFCCDTVNSAGRGSGEGCVKISEDYVDSCADVLYCEGNWTKSDGTVHCTKSD